MIDLVNIPIWPLAVLNAVLAAGFPAICSKIGKSSSTRMRAAAALIVAYAGIALRSAGDANSARVALILAAEGILVLGFGVLPFIGYLKTEVSAQRDGRTVDQARSNAMALRIVGVILGMLAVLLCIDAIVIHGFFGIHA